MKLKIFFSALFLILLILYNVNVNADIIAEWNGTLYIAEDNITVAWDAAERAEWYEIRLLWLDPKSGPVIYNIGRTSETRITISKPKVGHFSIQIRSCNQYGCSRWIESTNSGDVKNGKIFRIYFRLSPPSSINIE